MGEEKRKSGQRKEAKLTSRMKDLIGKKKKEKDGKRKVIN